MSLNDQVYYFEAVVESPMVDRQANGALDFKALLKKARVKGVPRNTKTYRVKFTVKDENGQEHLLAFDQRYVEINKGDKVTVICSKKTDYPLRLINRTTGKVWGLEYNDMVLPESKSAQKIAGIITIATSYIGALFRCAPVMNLVDMFISFFWIRRQALPAPPRTKIFLALAALIYFASYPIEYKYLMVLFEDSDVTIAKTEIVKQMSWPLAIATTNSFRLYSDIETNEEFLKFYHGDFYNPNQDANHLKFALILWVFIFSMAGMVFHGAFLGTLRLDQLQKQISLDAITKEYIEKKD